MDNVVVDFAAKKATVTMKEGSLAQGSVEAAFKGSPYAVSSFMQIVDKNRVYIADVSGMT